MFLLWIFGLLLIAGGLMLWLIAPAGDLPETAQDLQEHLYAHRGLHDGNQTVPENSMAAFEGAVKAGYGIELDVQRTRDGQVVVFHDETLLRVCGAPHRLGELTLDELTAYPLPDGSPIPLLGEVLDLVDGQAPLIVEVKHYGDAQANAAATLEVLEGYQGLYCMESFHPLAVRYFRRHAPHIVRGQLASGGAYQKGGVRLPLHLAMKHLLMNVLSRPHFIAYSYPNDRVACMWLMKHLFRPPLAAWTLRDQSTLDHALHWYQMPIFEGFLPFSQASETEKTNLHNE